MKSRSDLVRLLFKSVISIWILYHLIVIVFIPNGNSFIGKRYQSFFLPYANTLIMNTSWNFFSPDPAHVMYMKYLVYKDDDSEPEEAFFPLEKEGSTSDLVKRRNFYVMRFLGMVPNRFADFFVPWICKRNPAAARVYIEPMWFQIPPFESVIGTTEPTLDLLRQIEFPSGTYPCHKDEESK